VAKSVGASAMKSAMKITLITAVVSILTSLFSANLSASLHYSTEDIQKYVIEEATRQNVAPSLALAIAKVESNFNPQALSHAGAKGVMQIMPRTAEQGFGVSRQQLFDPQINIAVGVKFIKKLLTQYDGRLDIALSHYNGGSAVKNRHGNLSVIPATRQYVAKVLTTQQSFLRHGLLQQESLQHDILQKDSFLLKKPPLLVSLMEQQGVNYTQTNVEQYPVDLQLTAPHTSGSPQIETLRALRLHNITRNYKGKNALSLTNKPVVFKTKRSVSNDVKTRIEKVRQWESIYQD
jgi:hypothetical protein